METCLVCRYVVCLKLPSSAQSNGICAGLTWGFDFFPRTKADDPILKDPRRKSYGVLSIQEISVR